MRRKAFIFRLAAITIGLAVPIAAIECGLRFLPVNRPFRTVEVDARDPVIHFVANQEFVHSSGWFFEVVNRGHTNNYGYVSDLDYDPRDDRPLLAVVGDSYIEARMVPFCDTLQGRLETSVGGQGRVYSFAASGSPLSQYLAFAEFARDEFAPDGLVVLVVGNDFDESLLGVKNAPGFHYFKDTRSGEYDLVRVDYSPALRRRLVLHSALARYLLANSSGLYNLVTGRRGSVESYVGNTIAATDAERVRMSKRAVDEFLARLPQASSVPPSRTIILLDGIRPQLYEQTSLSEVKGTYFGVMRDYMLSRAIASGYEVIDLQPQFVAVHRRTGERFEWRVDSHWNANGHRVAADAVRASRTFAELFP